jgi:leucyl/phenylalanyl-tRNA--protein transferase
VRTPLSRPRIVRALLDAYRAGAFPMADPDTGDVAFYNAARRGVFPLEPGAFHVSRSLRRRLRAGEFEIRADADFRAVLHGCAAPRARRPDHTDDDDGTWLSDRVQDWAGMLHDADHAHSVEAWRTDPATGERALVGGVYGVTIGGAFCAESMFSTPRARLADGSRHPLDGTDASKACLAHLVAHLRRRGYVLLDTQLANPHLESLGCMEVSAKEYESRLRAAVQLPVTWGEFSPADPDEI